MYSGCDVTLLKSRIGYKLSYTFGYFRKVHSCKVCFKRINRVYIHNTNLFFKKSSVYWPSNTYLFSFLFDACVVIRLNQKKLHELPVLVKSAGTRSLTVPVNRFVSANLRKKSGPNRGGSQNAVAHLVYLYYIDIIFSIISIY